MISEARLRAALKLPDSFPAELLSDLQDRAVAFVEAQTRRYFGPPREVEEFHHGDDQAWMGLREYARGGVRRVEERAHPGSEPLAILLQSESDVGDFELRHGDTRSFLVRTLGAQWLRCREYTVFYTQGYEEDYGPMDIESLVISLIGLHARFDGKEGLSGEAIGGYSYTKAAVHAFEDGDLRSIPGAVRTIRAWQRLSIQ